MQNAFKTGFYWELFGPVTTCAMPVVIVWTRNIYARNVHFCCNSLLKLCIKYHGLSVGKLSCKLFLPYIASVVHSFFVLKACYNSNMRFRTLEHLTAWCINEWKRDNPDKASCMEKIHTRIGEIRCIVLHRIKVGEILIHEEPLFSQIHQGTLAPVMLDCALLL